jgi:hypothetical protein
VDALVACAADDEGLAAACCHSHGPFGRVALSRAVEVFECPGMVHLDLLPRSAELALVGHEPLDDLGAVAPDAGGVVVEGPWCGVACQRDAAPLRDQRRFSVPVHRDPKAGSVSRTARYRR